ncbi:hypothetical protein VTL71DRAFT_4627 [Oculimacula yallundae]|uniref:Protein kinase domain-containing protein n=1 Tax=Oculimacula yallundae TaxID=86028 RepID=A0ABR4C4X1_9HELO
MESLFSLQLPFQRRLTKMYTDTKSSYDFVKEPVQSAEDPELTLLHRKLRIQKDRLVSWGLEWSDPTQSPDIDESINKAGLSELVGSVMSTIKEILAEAEPLWQSSKQRSSDGKGPVSEKSVDRKPSLIVWDKNRFQDLVRDLTMSIDTLYDLSRTRQSPRKPPLKSEESSGSLQAKSPATEEKMFESTRMQTPQQIDPKSLIWPRDIRTIQSGTLPPAKSRRQIVFMRRPTSVSDSRKSVVPVLLEYEQYDAIYSITGITPSMTRFEKLFAALSQAYLSSDRILSGLLSLIGYFEEPDHSRFCLLYALPANFGPVDIESPRMPTINFLSDLLFSRNYEPSLEVKYRLAYNISNAVFDLHAKGVVHGNIASFNVLFFEQHAKGRVDFNQINMRQPYLTSCDLFSDNATDSSDSLADPRTKLYRHPLDPRTTRYGRFTSESKSLDLYSLAMLLLEIGLWTSLPGIFPTVSTVPDNPAGALRKLAARCGSLYVKAVQACWNAPKDELTRKARPDVMHQKVLWKVSKALDTCCAIDESSDESNEDSDDLLELSAPMKPSRSTTPQKRMISDSKPSAITLITSPPAAPRHERSAYEKAADSFVDRPNWTEKPLPIVSAPVVEKQKPKLRTYPSIRIAQEHLDFWHTGIIPHINHVLRGFYRKYPESVEISLESIGESPTTTKPTILVICTSVSKVRSILKKSLVYDQSIFGLKVCRGKVVRSRKRGPKRSMAGDVTNMKAANGDHQDLPMNGASIGAYVGERHLPPVSFGGLIMVDSKPYGMTVHHMLDDPSDGEDEEEEVQAPILRSSAWSSELPDLTQSESSVFDSGDEEYMYTLSDYESDFSEGEQESDDEEEDEDQDDFTSDSYMEPGDIRGVPQGCGEEYLITQPAIDDVSEDFYPNEETRDEDHLDSFQLGEVYASSGIRRRVENGTVHEIDWALFEFNEERCPQANHIKNGDRFCHHKPSEYPIAVAPAKDLSNLEVHCMARTSGLQSGRILPGMVIVKIYGRQTPSSSYQVAGKLLGIPGDSGAWVVDNKDGRACGHVLAWSSKKRVAYICPMDVLVRDIGETLNATSICLPGGEELYARTTSTGTSAPITLAEPGIHISNENENENENDDEDINLSQNINADINAEEIAQLLKELKLPPTPEQIDALDPASLNHFSHSTFPVQNNAASESSSAGAGIRGRDNNSPPFTLLGTTERVLKSAGRAQAQQQQNVGFMKGPGMDGGWGRGMSVGEREMLGSGVKGEADVQLGGVGRA